MFAIYSGTVVLSVERVGLSFPPRELDDVVIGMA